LGKKKNSCCPKKDLIEFEELIDFYKTNLNEYLNDTEKLKILKQELNKRQDKITKLKNIVGKNEQQEKKNNIITKF